MTATTCTVVTAATGAKCGRAAVHAFTGIAGDAFAECAAHTTAGVAVKRVGHGVGDHVVVRRHGKDFDAVITRVTRTGRAYAAFTYGNGAKRTVAVD